MGFCKNCGQQLNEGAKFCKVCGTAVGGQVQNVQATPVCKNCGKQLKDGVKFCNGCGTPTSEPVQVKPQEEHERIERERRNEQERIERERIAEQEKNEKAERERQEAEERRREQERLESERQEAEERRREQDRLERGRLAEQERKDKEERELREAEERHKEQERIERERLEVKEHEKPKLESKSFVAENAEVKQEPSSKGTIEKEKSKRNIYIGVAAGFILLCVISAVFLFTDIFGGKSSDTISHTTSQETIQESRISEINSTDADVQPKTVQQPVEEEKPAESKPSTPPAKQTSPVSASAAASGGATITYSFGKYEGKVVNGIPQGTDGTMTYTCRVQIAKHGNTTYYAERGDYFIGTWYNGDIQNGKLFDSNNNQKASITAGRRPSPYNLKNDKCE